MLAVQLEALASAFGLEERRPRAGVLTLSAMHAMHPERAVPLTAATPDVVVPPMMARAMGIDPPPALVVTDARGMRLFAPRRAAHGPGPTPEPSESLPHAVASAFGLAPTGAFLTPTTVRLSAR